MRKTGLIILALLISVLSYSQRIAGNSYWFYFTDKNGNGFSVDQAHEFLSPESVNRRAFQSIPVDQNDLPVTQEYIDSLKSLGLEIDYISKWLNGVLVSSNNQALIDTLYKIDFIDTLMWIPDPLDTYLPEMPMSERFDEAYANPPEYKYGNSFDQIHQLRIDALHEMGYTGKGVTLAILDAGFTDLEILPAFKIPLENGQISETRNFVNNENIFAMHPHGMNVSSLIIANWPDTLMGIAPDVELILAATENPETETRIEEFSWIRGAEWADSLGADIINTSLGYTTFDDSSTNFSYQSMDGKTAHISIANSMTASRGMLSATSAGNSGNDDWYYIGAPADATDILSVGSVDKTGSLASFSSRGPSYDHRIKPEVVAMGTLAAVQGSDGTARFGSGTSFASPLMAGAAAVLWQAYPNLSAKDLMQSIIEAGNQYSTADAAYGYGIPNFKIAYGSISSVKTTSIISDLKVFPNPFTNYINISLPQEIRGSHDLIIYDIQGRMMLQRIVEIPGRIDISTALKTGIYIMEVDTEAGPLRTRIIKN